jgi:hypothetical protein
MDLGPLTIYNRLEAHMNPECFNRPKSVSRWVGVILSLTVLLFAAQGRSQIAGAGNIQGTVSDATGAVIPDATVTATDAATQVKHVTKSGNAGGYLFPGLPIGTYVIDVVAPGFETYEQTGIVLEVGSSIAINVALAIGKQEIKMEVHAEGLALQTEDASFKQTVDQQDILEMPLNSVSRQITGLLAVSGGSVTAPGNDFTGSKYSYQTVSISVAGGNGNTTLWRLDGGDNQDYMGNGNLPFPFPDAVTQFSVESTVLGAQDGEHTGGMVNVVTRSGTNQFHGSAFEFIRNNFIDATNFYSTCSPVAPKTTCTAKDTLHQNQFGGTFGGPIKRNKLFAFAAYQRLKNDQSQASTEAFVPTAANLLGDFSVTDGVNCESSGKVVQLLDPLTGTPLTGDKYATPPTYNAQALALDKYLPMPIPSVDTNGCGEVSYAIPSEVFDNQFVTRVDYTVNAKNNLYGRYLIDGYQAPPFFSPTNILITTQSGNIERTQSFTLGDAYVIKPNLVNAAHATILRRVNNRGYSPSDINANTLGVTLSQVVPNGLQMAEGKFTIGGGTNSVSHFNDNTLAFDDDVTYLRGKHQIIFGGEWVQNQLNIGNAYEGNGVFTFNGQYSGNGPKGGSIIGDQSLDFLQGTLSAFQQSKEQQNALRGPIPSLYGQDTYHVTKRLTLVAGLRWGPNFMPTDYFNRGSIFNMADFLSNTVSTVYPNAPAGVLFYGDKGVPKGFTENSPWQFSPNVGFSFDPTGSGKTVIRAGAELAYDKPNFFSGQRVQQNPPFATAISNVQTSSTPPLTFSAPWSTGSITTSPFPQAEIPGPTAQFFSQSQYIFLPNQFHAAYTIQWTLSVQHDFSHGWQAQLDYIGNGTRHDPIGIPIDDAVFIPGEWGAGGTGCAGVVTTVPGFKAGAAGTNCSAATSASYSSRFALTKANPLQGNQFGGAGAGSTLVADSATASYNGLIASLNHRLSSTFSLLANWTWSKCLDEEDGQGDLSGVAVENPANIRLDYGPCGFDYRHVINTVIVAKSGFNRFNRIEKLALNNWEIAPLMHIQSGVAVNVLAGQDNSLTDNNEDRPNLVAGVNPYAKVKFQHSAGEASREYLNPAAFAQITNPSCDTGTNGAYVANGCAVLGTYGSIGRNAFRGTPSFQLDSQISRIFPIHESLSLDLRLEAFNMLNHPNFGAPNATITSSTFGQISSQSNAARVFQGAIKISF